MDRRPSTPAGPSRLSRPTSRFASVGASDYLFRALRNLVENALRHTPEGTTVSIVVANPPAISVIDRGPGVPLDQRHAIFRRFWQGDRDQNNGGAGLGMDIAARTVVAHGGIISVDDAPNGGAIFTMQFEALSRSRRGSHAARASGRYDLDPLMIVIFWRL